MPGPKPPTVPLSEAFRAHILLLLADGHTAPEVARRLGTSRRTVRLWRRHWLACPECPVAER